MTLATLRQQTGHPNAAELRCESHWLIILPLRKNFSEFAKAPGSSLLQAILKRRHMKIADLEATPLSAEIGEGTVLAWALLDRAKTRFEQQTAVRKAAQLLLGEKPVSLGIAVFGSDEERRLAAEMGVQVALYNGASLPSRKKKSDAKPLASVRLFGWKAADDFASLRAQAEGNLLTRTLTMLPPNDLTPVAYRSRIRTLAKEQRWQHKELDMKALRKMGAGAFVAVGQGSDPEDAAIVHLTYAPKRAKHSVALVGKGICFDTGGHNLKPAKYMYSMHEDMNGSAVALGILLAASKRKLPLRIDAWLALAQNHISPKAYKQNDVVKALNGTTIEIIHTDAEGRMVLSDTLTLAARQKPDLIIDFATLTGSMHVALGTRYSGIFSNRDEWITKSLQAGRASGERVSAFPMDADYDSALDSKIADVKQCSDDSYGDHILAARFLSRFVDDRPWIHMDLSGSSSTGGLGAVASDVTGFGVGWGLELLRSLE